MYIPTEVPKGSILSLFGLVSELLVLLSFQNNAIMNPMVLELASIIHQLRNVSLRSPLSSGNAWISSHKRDKGVSIYLESTL